MKYRFALSLKTAVTWLKPLRENERVRFAYGTESMPPVDWSRQPRLEAAYWPEERKQRTFRSYALEYVRTMLPTLQDLLGPQDTRVELGRVARLVGLQFHEETARELDLPTDVERGDRESARDFARWLMAILKAGGEEAEIFERDCALLVTLNGWRIARDLKLADPLLAFDAWNELWLGAAAAHDRFLEVETTRTLGEGGWRVSWRISPRPS